MTFTKVFLPNGELSEWLQLKSWKETLSVNFDEWVFVTDKWLCLLTIVTQLSQVSTQSQFVATSYALSLNKSLEFHIHASRFTCYVFHKDEAMIEERIFDRKCHLLYVIKVFVLLACCPLHTSAFLHVLPITTSIGKGWTNVFVLKLPLNTQINISLSQHVSKFKIA